MNVYQADPTAIYLKGVFKIVSNDTIQIFPENTPERLRLQALADRLNAVSKNERYSVEETYYDFGQGWRWTTVIARKQRGNTTEKYQALSPRQQDMIIHGSDDDIKTVYKEVFYE